MQRPLDQRSLEEATSQQLKQAGLSPLRAVDLGRCNSLAKARSKAKDKLGKEAVLVLAANVRAACDSGRGALWGLNADEIARLQSGDKLTLEDSAGRFTIGYSRFEE